LKKHIFIAFICSIWTVFGQAIYKESTAFKDSSTYYLEISQFNKEGKKNYKNAIKYTEKAIYFAKNNGNRIHLADAYLQLGTIFFELEQNNLAIDYFIRAVNSYDKKSPTSNLALTYYSLGKCYLKKKNTKVAEVYFEKAASLYTKFNFTEALELINLQKAIIEKEQKKYEEASVILKTVVQNLEQDTFLSTKSEAYFQLGEIAMQNINFSEAISYFTNALEANENNKSDFQYTKKILKQLSVAHEQNKNIQKAHYYLKKYAALNDSITKDFSAIDSENKVDKIQFDEQLKTIEQLDKEKKRQQKTLQFSKLIGFLSIALILILSLLSFSLYKNNKIRISTNLLLEDKNRELIAEKERAELASKARAEFLSTVSHELRTPLNAINGITYLLLQEKPKVSQLNYLKSLEFSGNYLLNFINDILEINRLESDKVIVEYINFNLKELVNNIITSFKEFIQENNIKFVLDFDDSIPMYLKGDPTKLSQIFINLINNAIKFSKNGNIWFILKKVTTIENKIQIQFQIKDDGIGIPLEKQKTIFESFSQGSVEINRTYGGTGLGLSIVKKILEILDSTIHLESESGKGCVFLFELQFEIGNENIVKVIENLKNDDYNEKTILLVEDNKINQMITKKMLEKKGISCVIIDNGEEAIEEVCNNHYDLILMDVHLTGINGTEATSAIRKINKKIPIIALTAISLNENIETLLSFGMNDVITKPFEPNHFYDVIRRYLA
jgi:signal transduction histidine kinase